MKKTLLAVALTAASMTAIADVSISGHTNYMLGSVEDFNSNKDLTVEQNGYSQSRFRFVFDSAEVNGITYGGRMEFGYSGQSNKESLTKRVNEVSASGSLGRILLGQGSVAGDGSSDSADFSGTGIINETSVYQIGGGDFAAAGVLDDFGRGQRLRYDSPAFGAVSVSVSLNDSNSATLSDGSSYSGQYAVDNFQANIAFQSQDADNSDRTNASIAYKMSGFSGSVQYHSAEQGAVTNDLEQVRVVLGYKTGPFAFAITSTQTELDNNAGVATTDMDTLGFGGVYKPTQGVELYAGVMKADNNIDVVGQDDSGTGVILGARVKF